MPTGQMLGQERSSDTRLTTTIHPNLAERMVSMNASALFDGFSEHQCIDIATCALVRTFARNELLFTQGQPAGSLIVLQSGSVKGSGENGESVSDRVVAGANCEWA